MTSTGIDLLSFKIIGKPVKHLNTVLRHTLSDKHATSRHRPRRLYRRTRRSLQTRRKHPRPTTTNKLQPFNRYRSRLHRARSVRRSLVEQPYYDRQYTTRYATGGYLSAAAHDQHGNRPRYVQPERLRSIGNEHRHGGYKCGGECGGEDQGCVGGYSCKNPASMGGWEEGG